MPKILFEPPLKNEPGYLRRQRTALEFKARADRGEQTPEMIDHLVEFLLVYVKEPENRTEARNALLDASEEQFYQLLDLVGGGDAQSAANPTPAKSKRSNIGSKAPSA